MKRYRIYFNRKNEAPQVWSVDEGTQASESNVSKVELHYVPHVEFRYLGGEANPDTPAAVCEVYGELTMEGGVAHIHGLPADGSDGRS